MKKLIANFLFFVAGWKCKYPDEYQSSRCVMIAAPHTSNWDLLYTVAVYWKEDVHAKFFIKDAYTKGILGFFFRWLGAIGIDRSKHSNTVDYAASLFEEYENLVLLVPAEGTRKRVEKWKTGFYHIAKKAGVPVSLGYLDYKKKIAGVGQMIHLSDSFEKDMERIEDFYKDVSGRHPELYNPKIFIREG